MDIKELREIAERTEEMLLEIGNPENLDDFDGYEDIYEFLAEGVLSIERKQNLVNDCWMTTEYSLCVGCGGPNVDVSTAGYIRVAWWSEPYYYHVGEAAQAILIDCAECLDEFYGEMN